MGLGAGGRLVAAVGLAVGAVLPAGPLAAQTGAPSRIAAPPLEADAAFDAARAAFERLPEADRTAVQEALVWTGDYATAAGSFGRRTYEAILAYQRRAGQPGTGILDARARQVLLAKGGEARVRAGFVPLTDPMTGIRIGVPQKILTRRGENPAGGTRLQSADGRITLDLRTATGGEAALKAAYERNLAMQSPGRTVSYHVLRPDFFVLSGDTASGRFYLRYAAGPDQIRGFSLGYDKALAPQLDRVVIAIANSFEPFPAPQGVAATQDAAQAADTAGGPPLPPRRPEGLEERTTSTGLAVAQRRILTSRGGAACRDPQVDGGPARLVREDAGSGLALLETAGDHVPATLAFAAPPATGDATVLFRSQSEGGRPVATPAALVAAGRLVAPLQDGAAGGVVLGPEGFVIGLVGAVSSERRAVAGLVPPAAYGYAESGALRRFLGGDPPPGAPGGVSGSSLAAAAGPLAASLVTVSCGPGGSR